MKVLLINPPSRRPLPSILPRGVEESRGKFPPLGLLYVAASLRGARSLEVEVMDAHAQGLGPDRIARRVAEDNPDLVGITVMTFTLLDAMETAAAVKTARPEAMMIAGGPHPHLFPEQTLALGPFDAVLRGEGEISFRELVSGWPGSRQKPPPGVWFKSGEKGEPAAAPLVEGLDRLPFPARELLPAGLYHSALTGLRPITTLMSSRGCPHRCVFCDRPHLGKKFRARSADNVFREMEEVAELGVKEAVFYDDTFTTSPERVRELAELILDRGLTLSWDIRARVSDLAREDYALCKRAGLCRVHFGVESGDPEILKSLHKGITIEQARSAFAWAREAGLETLAYFMVGLPGETESSLARTLELARELDPDFAHFSALIPFPGTPIYRQGLERGVIERDVWSEFAADPGPGFSPPLWEENLTEAEIKAALSKIYRSFYLRPGVILRRLWRVRSLSGLASGARMGAKILGLRSKQEET